MTSCSTSSSSSSAFHSPMSTKKSGLVFANRDLSQLIFGFLSGKDLARVSKVSQMTRRNAYETAQRLISNRGLKEMWQERGIGSLFRFLNTQEQFCVLQKVKPTIRVCKMTHEHAERADIISDKFLLTISHVAKSVTVHQPQLLLTRTLTEPIRGALIHGTSATTCTNSSLQLWDLPSLTICSQTLVNLGCYSRILLQRREDGILAAVNQSSGVMEFFANVRGGDQFLAHSFHFARNQTKDLIVAATFLRDNMFATLSFSGHLTLTDLNAALAFQFPWKLPSKRYKLGLNVEGMVSDFSENRLIVRARQEIQVLDTSHVFDSGLLHRKGILKFNTLGRVTAQDFFFPYLALATYDVVNRSKVCLFDLVQEKVVGEFAFPTNGAITSLHFKDSEMAVYCKREQSLIKCHW